MAKMEMIFFLTARNRNYFGRNFIHSFMMGNVINDIFDSGFYLYNLNFCAKILSDSVGIPCSRSSILRARLP